MVSAVILNKTALAASTLSASLAHMNPEYLWLVDAIQFLTIFVIGPALGLAIGYAAWRGKPSNLNPLRYGDDRVLFVASGVTAFLLFGFAKWLNADVRTVQFFLQVVCFLLGGLLLGVGTGCGFSVLLRLVRWHKTTRLSDNNQKDG